VGESLGLLVAAAGVERWDQVTPLQSLGCHVAHGYLLGPPLRAHDVGPCPTDDLAAWHSLLDRRSS
jgi:EAL domain-containing protein (putative c-di-GMP-specific phosphodiesterase class I)